MDEHWVVTIRQLDLGCLLQLFLTGPWVTNLHDAQLRQCLARLLLTEAEQQVDMILFGERNFQECGAVAAVDLLALVPFNVVELDEATGVTFRVLVDTDEVAPGLARVNTVVYDLTRSEPTVLVKDLCRRGLVHDADVEDSGFADNAKRVVINPAPVDDDLLDLNLFDALFLLKVEDLNYGARALVGT